MQKTRPSILLLGDSLTQLSFEGWGATLANVYQRRCDVLNRGYSGYNTKFYLEHILPDILLSPPTTMNVKLCILFFGANDAALARVDPHHHVSLDEYTANLTSMVTQIQTRHAASSTQILLMTPPPVHHEQRLRHQRQRYGDKATGVLERTNDVTGQYARACARVGDTLGVPVLPLYDLMLKESNWDEFFHDGLHFSPTGHEFVGKQILRAINSHFPSLRVVPDPQTGQWCNSGSTCADLSPNGPYHDEL